MRRFAPTLRSLLLIGVMVGLAFVFVPRPNRAIEWQWEIQTVPQVYINSPATFRDVVMLQNPNTKAYAGWIVGDAHGSATTLLSYSAGKWLDSAAAITDPDAVFHFNAIDGVYFEGRYRLFAAGKKTEASNDEGVVFYYDGTSWQDMTPLPGTSLPVFNAVSVTVEHQNTPDPADDVVWVFAGGDQEANNNNIWRRISDVDGNFAPANPWTRLNNGILNPSNLPHFNVTTLTSLAYGDSVRAWAGLKRGSDAYLVRNFNSQWNNEAFESVNEFRRANGEFHDLAAVANATGGNYYLRVVGSESGSAFVAGRDITGPWRSETPPGSPALPPLRGATGIFDSATSEYHFWAVGDVDQATGNGTVIFNFHQADNSGTWVRQDSRNGAKALQGIDVASRVKVVGVGDSNALIANSPGNIFGWGWFGGSSKTCSSASPEAYRGLTCANDSQCGGGTCVTVRDSLGWVSLSCVNLRTCEDANFSYGVNIAAEGSDAGQLSGYAWIGDGDFNQYREGDCQANVCQSSTTTPKASCNTDYDCRCSQNPAVCRSSGWVSFNAGDASSIVPVNCDPIIGKCTVNNSISCVADSQCPKTYVASYDQSSGKVSGWGRILAFDPTSGWIKLRGNTVLPPGGTYSSCGDCTGFDPTGSNGTCKICDQAPGGLNFSCNTCSLCNGNDETCGLCAFCDQYGVSINGANGKISGFAWSQDYGWLDFTRANYYSTAWLQTRFGDIYSRADIGTGATPPAPGISSGSPFGDLCNATYLIEARGTITNFCSESQSLSLIPDPVRGNTPDDFLFPGKKTQFTNALGTIEFAKMTTFKAGSAPTTQACSAGDCVIETGQNVYGDTLKRYTLQDSGKYYLDGYETSGGPQLNPSVIPCTGSPASQSTILNNTVYYFDGDLYVTSGAPGNCGALEFINGTANQSGAGMFIAKGKIVVNKPIQYRAANFSALSQLASAVLMSIESCVVFQSNASSVVGSYYAGGTCKWPTGSNVTAGIHIENPTIETPFELKGLLIAPSYKFSRTFRGTILNPEPSEKIFYDGRLTVNPPRGLQDFSLGFPSLRQISP